MHDTMIVPLGGRLLMAWYNCSENEIVGRTIIRGRWSADHGQTWSEPEIICEDVRPEHHMVPVTFTEENGEIWAYVTRMSSHDRPTGYVCVQYDHGEWKLRQEREELVLINTLPQETDGEWIAGGRMAAKPGELPLIPVVARFLQLVGNRSYAAALRDTYGHLCAAGCTITVNLIVGKQHRCARCQKKQQKHHQQNFAPSCSR